MTTVKGTNKQVKPTIKLSNKLDKKLLEQYSNCQKTINNFTSLIKNYMTNKDYLEVISCLEFAKKSHDGQFRKTGDPYIIHPVITATTLAEMELDKSVIISALLHDVLEDCDVSRKELVEKCGETVANLVVGVTKITVLEEKTLTNKTVDGEKRKTFNQATNVRNLIIAMSRDERVILIKLADRLHNLKTLHSLDPLSQKRIAKESLEIFAPLAHRLGLSNIKWQIEDEAFKYMMPREYHNISQCINLKRKDREEYTKKVVEIVCNKMEDEDIKCIVSGRVKHLYSTYNKLNRYIQDGRNFDDIYDLVALRIVNKSTDKGECYRTLGVIHSLWQPISSQFDDYIAKPKDNTYQSLHTAVYGPGLRKVEIQIRNIQMHQRAEDGVAAHWAYKEFKKIPNEDKFEKSLLNFKQSLHELNNSAEDILYVEAVKTDYLQNTIIVQTPEGDPIELKLGATPLDFAYKIHTQLGHNATRAKVNGKLVPFNTSLNDGDLIQITRSKRAQPRLDWLNTSLGYLKTSSARSKVRTWFRQIDKEKQIREGKNVLRRVRKKIALKVVPDELPKIFELNSLDALYERLGNGDLTAEVLTNTIFESLIETESEDSTIESDQCEQLKLITKIKQQPNKRVAAKANDKWEILVEGSSGVEVRFPKCCEPNPENPIAGYITRGRGVTVHEENCVNVQNNFEQERLIKTTWYNPSKIKKVKFSIKAKDRIGLIKSITDIIATNGINIIHMESVSIPENGKELIQMNITASCTNNQTVYNILSLLENNVPEVLYANRV